MLTISVFVEITLILHIAFLRYYTGAILKIWIFTSYTCLHSSWPMIYSIYFYKIRGRFGRILYFFTLSHWPIDYFFFVSKKDNQFYGYFHLYILYDNSFLPFVGEAFVTVISSRWYKPNKLKQTIQHLCSFFSFSKLIVLCWLNGYLRMLKVKVKGFFCIWYKLHANSMPFFLLHIFRPY